MRKTISADKVSGKFVEMMLDLCGFLGEDKYWVSDEHMKGSKEVYVYYNREDSSRYDVYINENENRWSRVTVCREKFDELFEENTKVLYYKKK